YTGIPPSEYSSLFDTVYVSLYKYFNAASGAILAGPRSIIENMFHTRRMFGSGLPESWAFAAVALHYMNGFIERFKKAIKTSEDLIKRMEKHPGIRIERIPFGTHVFKLDVEGVDGRLYRDKLKSRGVLVRAPEEGTGSFALYVNETLNLITASELANIFFQSLR